MYLGAGWPDLAGENQAVPQIVGVQNVARRHVDITVDHSRHTRTAVALPARMGHINPRIEQQVDQGLITRPTEVMPLTVEVDDGLCEI